MVDQKQKNQCCRAGAGAGAGGAEIIWWYWSRNRSRYLLAISAPAPGLQSQNYFFNKYRYFTKNVVSLENTRINKIKKHILPQLRNISDYFCSTFFMLLNQIFFHFISGNIWLEWS